MMAAAATPEPPPTTTLLELALALGYTVTDQRWRARAACAGADPEVFLTDRARRRNRRWSTAAAVRSAPKCLAAALELNQRAAGIWGGVSAKQRRTARQRGWDAARLLAEVARTT